MWRYAFLVAPLLVQSILVLPSAADEQHATTQGSEPNRERPYKESLPVNETRPSGLSESHPSRLSLQRRTPWIPQATLDQLRREYDERQARVGAPTQTPRTSVDLEHHPPERGQPARDEALEESREPTRTQLDHRTKVQVLHFSGDHTRPHIYWAALAGAYTATVVLRERTAWIMFDVIHLHRDRDDKFLAKMRTLHERASAFPGAATAGEGRCRHVYHIEPTCPAHITLIRDIVDARHREVASVFADSRVHYKEYPGTARLEVSNVGWAMRHSLSLKLNGLELGRSMGGSLSRLTSC